MTQADIKTELLENIYTDTKYFLVNKNTKLYKIFLVTKSIKNKKPASYTLTLIPDVSFDISPLALEANEYYANKGEYLSDLTVGVPFVDYEPNDAEAIYTTETSKNNFMRYDVYETAIKVSKDKIKNDTFIYEDFYTLWYPNLDATKKAIQSVLDAKNTKTYTFETFGNKVRKIENHEQIRPEPKEIVFEHLVKTESYLSEDISGLQIPIPQSKFISFDEANIEEGRIYFWIKKNEESISKSKINFFVLQNRKINGYIARSCKLGGFRSMYMHDNILTYSMSDEIQHLKNRVSKGFVEISQEEIIEMLTDKHSNDVLSQKNTHSIYIDNHVYDIYENMIQHWASGDSKEDFTNHTLFFQSIEKRDDWIKKELAEQKSRGTQLSEYDYKNFMKYSPLKVIEGNYEIDDSLLLNADETSLFITGDLIVNGTLMEDTQELIVSDNFLIVAGNVQAENYVGKRGFRFRFFAQKLIVKSITILNSNKKLHTDILFHGNTENIKGKNENLIFNYEYSTTNKKIFIDGFFNKNEIPDLHFIFNCLKQGKKLLVDDLNQNEIDNDLLLTSFKRSLKSWHSLYYSFAGFELQELECGEHYGHYIESDEIVKDIRHDTGMYLMSHDDLSLELVKAEKPINKDHVSSRDLAYRFFWIMWEHRDDGPMDYWQSIEAIDTRYNNGKSHFKEDPLLALYWIMHFGLLEDKRYVEMKELMRDSENSLVQGAFLFFSELKETKYYPIEKDYKINKTLFNNRIIHHKEQIKKAMAPEEDMVAYTMSQFEKQPERTLEFISELYKGEEWDKVSDYLENNPYQTGFSFLQIQTTKENDRSKWQELFIEEAEVNKETWNQTYILIDIFETFYKNLDYESTRIVLSIMMSLSSNSKCEKVYGKILKHLKTLPEPKNVSKVYKSRLKTATKGNFDFQTFLNKSVDIKLDDKIDFIRVCIEKDLFDEKISEKTTSPYLLVWFLADKDFYPVKKNKKTEEIKEVIAHYNLNKEDFKNKYRDTNKSEMTEFFSQIKEYF